jgi:type III restriction enzyme
MDAYPLKDYQADVLARVEDFLTAIKRTYAEKADYFAFQKQRGNEGIAPEQSDYLNEAWLHLKNQGKIPMYEIRKDYKDSIWQDRLDGMGRKIPNICLKVPTGGGKTFLSVAALQRINRDYFGRSTGLVLWVVPTDSIYSQTLKGLRNREHPYRMQLDIASGGQTKILERGDVFSPEDVDNNLCVMLLMLQSFNVGKASKDARKIFSDSGHYSAFFPDVDDYNANNALLNQVGNLVEEDMLERNVIQGLTIKQSLGNVFKMLRPIVVIDEEHKAKSEKAIQNINEFNPRFILELSATPRAGSNKLVDVGGQDLKTEHMIKLPIRVEASSQGDDAILILMIDDCLHFPQQNYDPYGLTSSSGCPSSSSIFCTFSSILSKSQGKNPNISAHSSPDNVTNKHAVSLLICSHGNNDRPSLQSIYRQRRRSFSIFPLSASSRMLLTTFFPSNRSILLFINAPEVTATKCFV